MNIGLPGTGLGGLFYIVLALAMPVRELVLRVRGRSRKPWRDVIRQASLAGAIIGALWIEGLLLSVLVNASRPANPTLANSGRIDQPATLVPVGISAEQFVPLAQASLVLTSATLLGLMLSLQVLRLLTRNRDPAPITPAAAA